MKEKKEKKIFEKIKKSLKKNKKDDNTFSFSEVSIIILCTTIISVLIGILFEKKLFRTENNYSSQLKELIENYQYIVESYYDEVDENKLVDAAINAIVNELDDTYSTYFSESQADNFDKLLTGSYEGIGVQVGQYTNGDIVIVAVYEDTSAYEAGMEVGDIIKKIDDKDVTGMSVKEVSNLIKNSENKKIYIDILRGKEEKKN